MSAQTWVPLAPGDLSRVLTGELRVPPDTWTRVIVASSGCGYAEEALSMSLDAEIVKHSAICDSDSQVWRPE